MFIKRFKIDGLFGYKTIEIVFGHPILIMIGENGYGKTTILNALNYTLQGCYKELLDIKFKAIEIQIEDNNYSFTREQLQEYYEYRQSDAERRSFVHFLQNELNPTEFDQLCTLVFQNKRKFSAVISNPIIKHYPENVLYHEVKSYLDRETRLGVFRSMKAHIESLNYNILFKPT